MAAPDPQDRTERALTLAREAEQASPALPVARRGTWFVSTGDAVRRPGMPPAAASLYTSALRGSWVGLPVRSHRARVAADAVLLAKISPAQGIKLRAAYASPGLSLAVQPRAGARRIDNAVRAHEVVAAVDPTLMPALRDHGRLPGGAAYLVEDWTQGVPLPGTRSVHLAAPELLERLGAVHRSFGITEVALGEHWGETFAQRWADTRATGIVPEGAHARVADLLQDPTRTLARSWCHGDLVMSNVLRVGDRHVLVDWEHSGPAPVMSDVVKLHLYSVEPERTVRDVLAVWADLPGAFTPAEQLVLSHARSISAYPTRRVVTAAQGRGQIYERQVRRQVERLQQVLDLS